MLVAETAALDRRRVDGSDNNRNGSMDETRHLIVSSHLRLPSEHPTINSNYRNRVS